MPKKRRKLSKEMELKIASAKRRVELITAIIYDINDEDIQGEYRNAFNSVKYAYTYLTSLYDAEGITETSETALVEYQNLLETFEQEYEV